MSQQPMKPPLFPGPLGLGSRPVPARTLAELLGIPEKRKIFVSYHHDLDQAYYDALARMVDDFEFLQDRSVDRLIGSDDPEYQERRIREKYIKGTSATIVLCGAQTYQRKFVDWEIYATLDKDGGLIGIALPTATTTREGIIVPPRLHENIQSGYALWRHWIHLTGPNLRAWIEEAVKKDKALIRNSSDKKPRNG